jgi:hypothetical protein
VLRPVRLLLAAAALVGVAAVAAPTASAGSYTVWSCRDGAGRAAPTDGWTISRQDFSPAAAGFISDTCSTGGVLTTAISGAEGARIYAPMRLGWTYTAPADVTLSSVQLETSWGVSLPGSDDGAGPMVGISRAGLMTGRNDPNLFVGCASNACNRAEVGSETLTPVDRTFGLAIACFALPNTSVGVPSCAASNSGRAHLYMHRARFTMTENLAPTALALDESVLGAQPLSGQRILRFNAYDKGSGLYAAEVKLGGRVVWGRSVVNENGGSCTAALKGTGFRGGMPCQPWLPLSLAINTADVPDGTHQLTVTLWDAADNQATVIDRSVTVRNATASSTPTPTSVPTPTPAPTTVPGIGSAPAVSANGTGGNVATARFSSKSTQTTRATQYGRTITLADQLVDAGGTAIVGADVDVFETRGGGTSQKVATVKSDDRGKIRHKPSTTASGLIEFAYAPTVGSASYVARRSVVLRVSAGVTLKASKRDVRRRMPVLFSGVLNAGALPKGGLQVAIETRGPGGWRLAKLVDTDAKGRFSWKYAFQNAAKWQFRARVMRSADLKVQPGTSPVVKVRVRR